MYKNNLAPIYKTGKQKSRATLRLARTTPYAKLGGLGELGRSQRLPQTNSVAFSFTKHKKMGIPLKLLEARKLIWLQLQPRSQQMRVSWC